MKKLSTLLLTAALASAMLLSGCGGAPTTTQQTSNTTQTTDKLVMGTNAAFPPYEFVDENNEFGGIDVEIAQAVADKLGKTLEIKDMAFDSLIPAVSGGAVDVVLAGMTVTDERLESVNFSNSYATGIQVVIVPEGSPITTIADLDGKKIGVQSGTTGDIYCADSYGEDAILRYDNGALAIQALQNGQVDCVIIDNEPAKAFVQANDGLTILETEFAVEEYAAAIAKDNDALLQEFNGALDELKAQGKLDEIIGKYIKAE